MQKYERAPLTIVALLLATSVMGCDDEAPPIEGPYGLTISGAGYDPHQGTELSLVVVDDATNEVVGRDELTLVDGTFELQFDSLLEDGRLYHIDFFADVDDDGFCDEPPADHVWREQLDRVTGVVTVEVTHTTSFNADACEHFDRVTEDFDLTFSGSGYDPHEGQSFSVAVVDDETGDVMTQATTLISGGAFAFTFVDIFEAHGSYHVDYYADFNENGGCDAPPDDHVWRDELGEVTGDVVHVVTHNLNFNAEACEHFPRGVQRYNLAFAGSGYSPHLGQTFAVALVDDETDEVVLEEEVTLDDGTFSLIFESVLLAGASYHLDYYADFNDSGGCDAPPTDHVWRDELGEVTGDIVHVVTHNLNFTPEACEHFSGAGGLFDISVIGSGFTPHEGNVFGVALVDESNGEVVAEQLTSISGGAFSVTFEDALVAGRGYHVDSYADFNDNGRCDAPPDDHAWREPIAPVAGDVELEVTHNLNFEADACASFSDQRFTLDFTGTGYTPHEGQTFGIAVVRESTGEVVASDSAVVTDGGVWFGFPGVLIPGERYHVDSYADFNENGRCDAPPDDHAWQEPVASVTGDVYLAVTHNLDFAPEACDSF